MSAAMWIQNKAEISKSSYSQDSYTVTESTYFLLPVLCSRGQNQGEQV